MKTYWRVGPRTADVTPCVSTLCNVRRRTIFCTTYTSGWQCGTVNACWCRRYLQDPAILELNLSIYILRVPSSRNFVRAFKCIYRYCCIIYMFKCVYWLFWWSLFLSMVEWHTCSLLFPCLGYTITSPRAGGRHYLSTSYYLYHLHSVVSITIYNLQYCHRRHNTIFTTCNRVYFIHNMFRPRGPSSGDTQTLTLKALNCFLIWYHISVPFG
jgi:hypothetical protein